MAANLIPLNFHIEDIDNYATEFVNVDSYKTLNFVIKTTHNAELTIVQSIDGHDETLKNIYMLHKSRPNTARIDITCEYIRYIISRIDETNDLISVLCHTRGRRQINSQLGKLLNIFEKNNQEPPKLELPEERQTWRKLLPSTPRGLQKREAKKEESHKCRCEILPMLLLRGSILYVDYNNHLSTIGAAPDDGQLYTLTMRNRVPQWLIPSEGGWF